MKARLNENGVPEEMEDFDFLNALIQNHPSGVFTLREMFGSLWLSFKRQRHYGRWFKRHLAMGLISGISIYRKRSNGSWEYIIHSSFVSRISREIKVNGGLS
jgi:hypothetical protein